ncbi:protein FAR1-RELATED SEQUENCE 5-like [Helianthus annuus]|uniref:protein FAR1-RELATED SEQUENCE 5-like n=1 Tax=Helianthus annuus TaxID=4232 RepID=UPI000B8F4493|nr:protein FAR1-RELATED SEQUENCE 5-like [Helianthus annuus]
MDLQNSTGRKTDVEFEDARSVGKPPTPPRERELRTRASDEGLYIPEVEASSTPVVGMQFSSVEQAYVFYQTYAKLAEGHKPLFIDDAHSKSRKPYKTRNRGTIRTGYKAQLMICSVDESSFTVKKFVDGHNHKFVCPQDIHMLPTYKKLSEVQEEMIWELGTLNLGPVKAFHIMRKRYGGFEKVGTTVDDCKNFRTRSNSYIGEYDADMVINRLTDKKEYLVDFSFEYSVDEDKRLTSLFWVVWLCKRNFMEFGDVISFDATFKTNKYKMVFIRFTGIDNHCRNVTLGAGLLVSESTESYKWLLNSLVNSFGRQPKVVVTDQEPAMKQAIEGVFTTSRHRLCMWHIMKKMADKVGHELCNNEEFKRKMCDIIWSDSIEPGVFERQWKLVMIDFEFMNHFDGSMDVQRFNHRKNDHISRYTELVDWRKTTLEADAAKIYTRSIFFDQQTEIYRTISECLPMDTKIEGDQCVSRNLNSTGCYVNTSVFFSRCDAKDEQYKAKQIAHEIMYTGEYLVSNLITDLDQLILVRDQMKEIKEKVD